MPDYAAFHQALHCLLLCEKKSSSEKEIFWGGGGIISCDPSIYIMNHPAIIVCSFMENSIALKRVDNKGIQYLIFPLVILPSKSLGIPFPHLGQANLALSCKSRKQCSHMMSLHGSIIGGSSISFSHWQHFSLVLEKNRKGIMKKCEISFFL